MLPGFDVTVVCLDDVAHVTVAGEIDEATIDRFNRGLRDAVYEAEHAVALDLSQVTFIGSSGISALLRARTFALDRGVRFWISQASRQVERVLDLMGILDDLREGPAQ